MLQHVIVIPQNKLENEDETGGLIYFTIENVWLDLKPTISNRTK